MGVLLNLGFMDLKKIERNNMTWNDAFIELTLLKDLKSELEFDYLTKGFIKNLIYLIFLDEAIKLYEDCYALEGYQIMTVNKVLNYLLQHKYFSKSVLSKEKFLKRTGNILKAFNFLGLFDKNSSKVNSYSNTLNLTI